MGLLKDNIMKKTLLTLVIVLASTYLWSKKIDEIDYKRSSIYSILVNHTEQKYASFISDVFCKMPMPDKYNEHNLSVRILTTNKQTPEDGSLFLEQNDIASRLVSKWFNRNQETGECNTELIKERGLYNASMFDMMFASQTVRGNSMLADAGEELIGNTFVLVNDIRYVDAEKQAQAASIGIAVGSALLGAFVGAAQNSNKQSDNNNAGNAISNLGMLAANIVSTIKGFKVVVHTYLYQLVWDDETADFFYGSLYSEKADPYKINLFNESRKKFKLKYIGKQLSNGRDISCMGVNLDTPDQMVMKACTRAIDENCANLAKNFEQFKIKEKIVSTSPITVAIGKKEEITENSKFEVLQPVEKSNGTISYRQVAIIKPRRGLIWDNRYMAKEENAVGSSLNGTTFYKVSGGKIVPGMLVRELK